MSVKKILVTGGSGYIGSHTVVELQKSGFEVVIVDNFSNSNVDIIDRIALITGIKPEYYCVDLCNKEELVEVFRKETYFDVIIHFAAFKAVAESVKLPLKYYKNNLISLINLLECMNEFQCHNIVFSSSATVYGEPAELPLKESSPTSKPLSAYGSTKQMGEDILSMVAQAGGTKAIALRYFNPVGAHETALIGELPSGIPNNLMPFLTQVAAGIRNELTVYGKDYQTKDGTCIRDFIHVVDLAHAHVKSCQRLIERSSTEAYEVFNIGTGMGYSILEVIDEFQKQNQLKLKYSFGERRSGDVQAMFADASKAASLLGWKAEKTLTDMVVDSWRWEQKNRELLS